MKNAVILFCATIILGFGQIIRFNDLQDVSIASPTNGQLLKYNGSGWTNGNFTLGGNLSTTSTGAITDNSELGTIHAVTDDNGDVTILHGLDTSLFNVAVEVSDTMLYLTTVHSKTNTSFKIRFWSIDSVGIPLANTSVTGTWRAQIPIEKLFLDRFPNAGRAYALTKLRNGYTGPLVSIRKAGSGSYKSFYPDEAYSLSLNSLDSSGATLATYISSSNGYVAKWFDQSGNGYDAVTNDTTLQPKIVASGAIVTSGGKPAMTFNSDALTFTELSGSLYTVITISDALTVGGSQSIILGGDDSNNYFSYRSSDTVNQVRLGGGVAKVFTSADTRLRQMIFCTKGASSTEMWENNTSLGTTTNFNATTFKLRFIGKWQTSSSFYYSGEINAIILYAADKSNDRVKMSEYLNHIYEIY